MKLIQPAEEKIEGKSAKLTNALADLSLTTWQPKVVAASWSAKWFNSEIIILSFDRQTARLLKGASSHRTWKTLEKCGSAVGGLIASTYKNRQTARARDIFWIVFRLLSASHKSRNRRRKTICAVYSLYKLPARDNLYILLRKCERDKDKSALTIIMCILTTQ